MIRMVSVQISFPEKEASRFVWIGQSYRKLKWTAVHSLKGSWWICVDRSEFRITQVPIPEKEAGGICVNRPEFRIRQGNQCLFLKRKLVGFV